mmetsp:Transcript_116314/g.324057  ORF Transcript_116314/g.324057 Transcript_116314/m.324057 type:complete len:225 (+) Transcript_116314:1371-2045(+)
MVQGLFLRPDLLPRAALRGAELLEPARAEVHRGLSRAEGRPGLPDCSRRAAAGTAQEMAMDGGSPETPAPVHDGRGFAGGGRDGYQHSPCTGELHVTEHAIPLARCGVFHGRPWDVHDTDCSRGCGVPLRRHPSPGGLCPAVRDGRRLHNRTLLARLLGHHWPQLCVEAGSVHAAAEGHRRADVHEPVGAAGRGHQHAADEGDRAHPPPARAELRQDCHPLRST